jgi:hypothetical protein
MYKLPIGYDDFGKIREKQLGFVDKTLFIKDVIDNKEVEVLVFTRPRRFGKTLNLSMLHHFLAENVRGRPTQGMFDGLKISAFREEYLQYQSRCPVIALTLKDIKTSNFEMAIEKFGYLLSDLYREHHYLLSSPRLEDSDKKIFQAILSKSAPRMLLEDAITNLTRYLTLHHNTRPWLLLDEYDSPIISSYINGYYSEMIEFMRGLMGKALKSNAYLEKSVITGILRVAKESLFSGINNVRVYSILNSQYSEYFGFTEEEVIEVLQKYGLTEHYNGIRQWYNGYKIGDTTIYNPWSLANSVNDGGRLQPYWTNTSDNALVKQLLARGDDLIKMQLESLIQNESISAMIDENLVFNDLNQSDNAVWSLLLFSGYLKVLHAERKDDQIQCELLAPNYEVASLYRGIVRGWLSDPLGYEGHLLFLLSLTEARVDEFTRRLQKYLLQTASIFDVSGKEPEKFYHGLVLGMIVGLSETHEVLSNRESGYGRYDVLLIPKDTEQWGIIMEFKVATESDLNVSAQDALAQIQRRDYAAALRQKGLTNILHMGLAFKGKEVAVVTDIQPSTLKEEKFQFSRAAIN